MREVRFYRTKAGHSPVEEFLDALSGKQAQKVAWVLRLIEEIEAVPSQYLKNLSARKVSRKYGLSTGATRFG